MLVQRFTQPCVTALLLSEFRLLRGVRITDDNHRDGTQIRISFDPLTVIRASGGRQRKGKIDQVRSFVAHHRQGCIAIVGLENFSWSFLQELAFYVPKQRRKAVPTETVISTNSTP